ALEPSRQISCHNSELPAEMSNSRSLPLVSHFTLTDCPAQFTLRTQYLFKQQSASKPSAAHRQSGAARAKLPKTATSTAALNERITVVCVAMFIVIPTPCL